MCSRYVDCTLFQQEDEMTNKKSTDEYLDEMIRRYKSGESLSSIAEDYPISRKTVGRRIKSAGVDTRQNRKTSKDDEDEICKRYKNGESPYDIAEDYNITPQAVYNKLEKRDIERSKEVTFSDDEIDNIKQLYRDGQSTASIGNRFDVSAGVINKKLRENGVEIRNLSESHRKHTFKEDAFESLNNETLYWLGFLITDGGIYNPEYGQKQILLSLSTKDEEHVEKFKKFLNAEHPIVTNERDGYTSARITITSDEMASDLRDYGITQRKSFTAKASDELIDSRHFWRGVIDGDGCISTRKNGTPRLRLHTAEPLTKQFDRYIKTVCTTEAQARPHKNNIYVFGLTGGPAKKAIKHLYSDTSTYLERKKSLANDITQ